MRDVSRVFRFGFNGDPEERAVEHGLPAPPHQRDGVPDPVAWCPRRSRLYVGGLHPVDPRQRPSASRQTGRLADGPGIAPYDPACRPPPSSPGCAGSGRRSSTDPWGPHVAGTQPRMPPHAAGWYRLPVERGPARRRSDGDPTYRLTDVGLLPTVPRSSREADVGRAPGHLPQRRLHPA